MASQPVGGRAREFPGLPRKAYRPYRWGTCRTVLSRRRRMQNWVLDSSRADTDRRWLQAELPACLTEPANRSRHEAAAEGEIQNVEHERT
jgi:hypothetical protein